MVTPPPPPATIDEEVEGGQGGQPVEKSEGREKMGEEKRDPEAADASETLTPTPVTIISPPSPAPSPTPTPWSEKGGFITPPG